MSDRKPTVSVSAAYDLLAAAPAIRVAYLANRLLGVEPAGAAFAAVGSAGLAPDALPMGDIRDIVAQGKIARMNAVAQALASRLEGWLVASTSVPSPPPIVE